MYVVSFELASILHYMHGWKPAKSFRCQPMKHLALLNTNSDYCGNYKNKKYP